MKKLGLASSIAAILFALIFLSVGIWFLLSPTERPQSPRSSNTSSPTIRESSTAQRQAGSISPERSSLVSQGLQAIFTGLEKAGMKRISSAQEAIQEALATKDRKAISQAMNDLVYGSPWKREDILAALRTLLTHEYPWVRMHAAKYLYVMGDAASGRPTLVGLMQSLSPIWDVSDVYSSGRHDMRLSAADSVAKFRDTEASAAVLDLYNKTHSRELLDDLVKVGADDVVSIIKNALGNNRASYRRMELYGLAEAKSETGFITEVFNDSSKDVETRLAAAWALSRMNGDPQAVGYMTTFVADQLANGTPDPVLARKAVKYLGTSDDPNAIATLEQVVQSSSNTGMVRAAAVNLVLNHSDQSSVAQGMVIQELSGKITGLGLELSIQLAGAITSPELQQVAEAFDARRDGEKLWKQQGKARKQWSVWSWADQYVLAVKRP